jgi:pyruvate formate lyase activating enzyme
MTGTIFNIQRYSVNDGPGIRTTVFLKGCPLHCKWCHNPESISSDKEIILREDHCIRCGDCFSTCEQHAVHRNGSGFVTEREKCIQCGHCIDVCYTEARALVGKEQTVDDVMSEIIKDVIFYSESGGGATFSGGEPLLQHEFLISLLTACKQNNIHTAVDTSGYTSPAILEGVSNSVDLFLYDIKTLDDTTHKNFTGVSNKLILDNLRKLTEWHNNVIVRIPIIPGINDDLEQMRQLGKFILSLKQIHEIHLLPYHQTGIEKYRRLGLDYPMKYTIQPKQDSLNKIVSELKLFIPNVLIGG